MLEMNTTQSFPMLKSNIYIQLSFYLIFTNKRYIAVKLANINGNKITTTVM